ncbi:hypothetical protein CP985_08965 [Malaciobacter mytili LMG 24559]|uniref:Uncharacterized protein n=1 Tax=Malaciobacter mytili LMG 24559 TaxID=1032238 RepID=A0AAX2AIM4_9BACT|nr:hypothetical protein [Malaciobacter mytili]AXH15350.1 hypothetical protein AMYT_1778 [Malaciobacter mytili LMG 24559]RXK15371.1 hypothetical protein CP985_08965 [Malaciobacter mytili LMG 24559]
MKKNELIKQKFKKTNLVESIAKYQIYYQIALGILVKDSCFDKDEMALKLQELQLDIDIENILNIIVKLINTFYEEKEFEEIFEDNIKLNAFLHSLKDFMTKNSDLTEKTFEVYQQKIMNDEFFDIRMQLHFQEELEERKAYWENLITPKIAMDLEESALKMI